MAIYYGFLFLGLFFTIAQDKPVNEPRCHDCPPFYFFSSFILLRSSNWREMFGKTFDFEESHLFPYNREYLKYKALTMTLRSGQ